MTNNIHVGDFGQTFKFTIVDQDSTVLDISTASGIVFVFEKPDTVQIEKDGHVLTDGTDGVVFYVVESGVFDLPGYWKVEAIISSETYQYTTNTARFKVAEEL